METFKGATLRQVVKSWTKEEEDTEEFFRLVARQNVSQIKALLTQGKVDLEALEPNGLTALGIACTTGNIELVDLLLKVGTATLHV